VGVTTTEAEEARDGAVEGSVLNRESHNLARIRLWLHLVLTVRRLNHYSPPVEFGVHCVSIHLVLTKSFQIADSHANVFVDGGTKLFLYMLRIRVQEAL